MKRILFVLCLGLFISSCTTSETNDTEITEVPERPNILFIMSDDHAKKAISAYDKSLISTPSIDRIANEGILITKGFVTNSICGPARAAILTSKYSHINGFRDNLDKFNGDQLTFPKLFQKEGYETSIFGKWHLKSEPQGFDDWEILIGQGEYYNPRIVSPSDTNKIIGYTSDVITDLALQKLNERDTTKPFMMMVHHKAPHRNWMPNTKHLDLFREDLPEPDNLFDDYEGRQAAAEQDLSIDRMFMGLDMKLKKEHFGTDPGSGGGPENFNSERAWENTYNWLTDEQKAAWDAHYDTVIQNFVNANLEGKELVSWMYQRYMKDYLRCIISVDENVGRLLDYLDETGLADNTIVVYTSDQGFFLGEHGWYDKRFMYEETFGTPMMIRYPDGFEGGKQMDDLVVNIDWAPTFLDYAGIEIPAEMQGRSLKPLIEGDSIQWRDGVYYHYYEYPHGWHSVKRHYGVRTDRYKLIHFYNDIDKWELYDLENDPDEMNNLIDHPEYLDIQDRLKQQLKLLQEEFSDEVTSDL